MTIKTIKDLISISPDITQKNWNNNKNIIKIFFNNINNNNNYIFLDRKGLKDSLKEIIIDNEITRYRLFYNGKGTDIYFTYQGHINLFNTNYRDYFAYLVDTSKHNEKLYHIRIIHIEKYKLFFDLIANKYTVEQICIHLSDQNKDELEESLKVLNDYIQYFGIKNYIRCNEKNMCKCITQNYQNIVIDETTFDYII